METRSGNRNDPFTRIRADGDPRSISSLAVRFLQDIEVKGLSRQTAYNRGKSISYFIAWCAERDVKRPPEVTRSVLKRYQRWLFYRRKQDGTPLSLSTQSHWLTGINMFFRWLTRQDYLDHNPAADLELPRMSRRLPKAVLSPEDAERVMAQADLTDPFGLRDRAIMEVFYSTGIRRGELCNLDVTDIDYRRGQLLVRLGKGAKDRIVPIGERALFWLGRYLDEVRPNLVVEPDERALFLAAQGKPLSENSLGAYVRDYLTTAGFENRGGCHLFRHSCATSMLEGGADIRYIQQMLGHARIESTAIYTQVAITKLKEIHTATHPAAKMRPTTSR